MERIGVRELNQNTSQVLARVSGGETVEITDRGRPIARLVPVSDDRSTLAKLVAAGRAVSPTGGGKVPLPPKLGAEIIIIVIGGGDADRVLLPRHNELEMPGLAAFGSGKDDTAAVADGRRGQ